MTEAHTTKNEEKEESNTSEGRRAHKEETPDGQLAEGEGELTETLTLTQEETVTMEGSLSGLGLKGNELDERKGLKEFGVEEKLMETISLPPQDVEYVDMLVCLGFFPGPRETVRVFYILKKEVTFKIGIINTGDLLEFLSDLRVATGVRASLMGGIPEIPWRREEGDAVRRLFTTPRGASTRAQRMCFILQRLRPHRPEEP